jgi:hypothetical protein
MKIALIGSAPSSVALAPYDDESWTIWACSPGAYCHLKRVDRFFELHRFMPASGDWSAGYIEWMKGLAAPIYMIEPLPEFPTSVAYPAAEMLERFGPNFFTSSLAWMAALALTQEGIEEIGFWGVDMAATEEYGLQKPGCLYFVEMARQMGVKVTTPPESDLLRPLPLYGIGEANPMRIKLMTRRAELTAKRDSCAQDAANLQAQWEAKIREQAFFQGALDDNQYMLNTWCE